MSAAESGKKIVTFKAADKAKKNNIPTTIAPNQVVLAGGPAGAERSDTDLEDTPLRSRTAVDEQFPTEALSAADPRDAVQTAKLELAAAQGTPGVTPFGRLIATDSDFEWLRHKREKEAEANFQQWFASNFDKMSPEQKKLAREIWPEFYQQRLELLEKQINLQRRLARLKVTGVQSKEDLLLQYAAEAGFIDNDPLDHILHPERAADAQDKAERQKRFVRGLFSPRRLPRGDWGTFAREDNAQRLLGRSAQSFGNVPAYTLGTSNGFSAVGTVDDTTEMEAGYERQLNALLA